MAKGDQTYDGELGKPRKSVNEGEAIVVEILKRACRNEGSIGFMGLDMEL